MTHDELLVSINMNGQTTGGLEQNTDALRAVVELHKPYEHELVNYVFCKGCTNEAYLAQPYPCPTIQAIEEQLK